MSHTSNHATQFLTERLGITPLEDKPDPSVLRGLLQTSDYQTFEIHDDGGTLLYSFEGAKAANRCLPGDHVVWDGQSCQLELRDEHPPLVGVIELTNPIRYGYTSHRVPLCLFTPYDRRYPPMVVGCSEKDKTRNRIGIVQWMNWPTTSVFPRGALQRVLGISGDVEVEKKAILHRACPWKYPSHTFQPRVLDTPSLQRTPLTGTTFHIDPEGCRDVDDVFTIEALDDCLWRVTITISDVAAFVEEGSAIDIMASLISQTVYDTAGKVLAPMLPAEYSENACSLLPNKTSYGLSLQFLWNGSSISECSWFESVFVTHHSYTYESFREAPSSLIRVVQDVASALAGREVEDPHEWVEQWMLYYNRQAGHLLKGAGMGILRRHLAPDRERLERYRTHLPEWQQLAMSSASYVLAEEADTIHYGLETDAYAHTTSPIRRYADLVNQRALKQYLHQGVSRYIVPVTMYEMNRREKAIKQFARELTFLEAMQTGRTLARALVLEKELVSDSECRVRYYVPEWKKTVSTTYRTTENGGLCSRDGTHTIELQEFSEVMLQCSAYSAHLHPRKRMVFQILSDSVGNL